MTDGDYLYDRSGAVDPDVARLESLLAPYRHRASPGPLPARDRTIELPPRRGLHAALYLSAVAASLLLVAASARIGIADRARGWTVRPLDGAPTIAGNRLSGEAVLTRGQTLTTDAGSRAQIDVGEIGTVDVDPNSRVRLLRAGSPDHRLALERGRIHARIAAPPRSFYVNTPSATAVDLGCAYTLEVDEDGWGQLRVDTGWVAFDAAGRESFVPQDAICAIAPGYGPGTPRYADAAPAFVEALTILDFSPTQDVRRPGALDTLLGAARRRDALTLWHLLPRVGAAERGRVYDRLAALVPAPQGVTRESVLDRDPQALDAWWDALGLDSAAWWRLWKRPWRP